MCPYKENGYENRKEYLKSLESEYGNIVWELSAILGESEDFDGLVTSCEDYQDGY